jgi:cytosine deaminase
MADHHPFARARWLGCDVVVTNGRIVDVAPRVSATATHALDAGGYLLAAVRRCPFSRTRRSLTVCRASIKAARCSKASRCGANSSHRSGRKHWSSAPRLLRLAVARRALAIRSHVDVRDPRLLAVEALLHVREK